MAVTIGHRQVANSTWAAMTPSEREAFRTQVALEALERDTQATRAASAARENTTKEKN